MLKRKPFVLISLIIFLISFPVFSDENKSEETEETIVYIESAKKTGAVVCVEEHNVIGGLGSAVCDCLCAQCPTPVEIIGTKDVFGCSGKPDELLDHYEMSAPHIVKAAKKVIGRK